jgi:crotonobetainyl-CoA:carnitine CoA-transferase CaiB-like acyl-CoA transferase
MQTKDGYLMVGAAGEAIWAKALGHPEWCDDPQVGHRGLVQYASDPELGEVSHIRTPVTIGEGVRVRTAAPKLGQHNAEIFGHLGIGEAEMKELQANGVL